MDNQNKNQKKPEAKPEAPGVPFPFTSRLRPAYLDIHPIDHRLSMRPVSWSTPSLVPPPGKPYNHFSLEETSREHVPLHDTSSTPEPSRLPPLTPSSRKRKYDSISTSSPPSSPEASRAASPKHSTLAKPKERNPISVLLEDCTARLAALRDLFGPDHPMFRQAQEGKRWPSLISTDESDSDYIDLDSGSESESSQEQEKKSSPIPSCTDESDGDYINPDTESETESEPESVPEPEPEPFQEQGRELWPRVSAKMLRTMTETEEDLYDLYRPPIPSWNDLGPRDDDKLYGDLFGLVPAPPLTPRLPTATLSRQEPAAPSREQEEYQSPTPFELSQAFEKAFEKKQREDHELDSAKPSLSQDLEKKMLSSLSAYDLNIEKLGQDIRDRCDHICERFYHLEKEKCGKKMFPGRSAHDLAIQKLANDQTRRRLEGIYRERFGYSGNAIAGPSREREQMVSPSPNLDEMIEQEPRRREKKKSPGPDPDSELEISEKGAREETDATISEPSQEEEKNALPDDETVMELEKDLGKGQDSLPASPSSSQRRKRKRPSVSDCEKSFFENFEKMRKHVRESVEREKKRRKKSADQSFEECMNELYPADSEIWKIDDEPLQVQSSKPIESRPDKDLGNSSLSSSDEYLSNEKEIRRLEESINDVSKGSAPFAGMAPLPTLLSPMPPFPPFPPMPNMSNMLPFPAMPPFPTISAMPDDLFDLGPLRWPISRPACVGLPPFMPYHAVCLATSLDHKQWIPETESLEAVSDKPFNEWVDITGVREFIHHEISSIGTRKVTIEACRVKGERNIRLMAFVLKKDNPWILSIYELSHSLARISGRLSSMGIDDVKVEVWETDFHLMVV